MNPSLKRCDARHRIFRNRWVGLLVAALALVPTIGSARGETTQSAPWRVSDIAGKSVTVPAADKPTLLAFVMVDQDRSLTAIKQVQEVVGDDAALQLVAVVSGKDAPAHAASFAAASHWTQPIVADENYEASGRFGVRVWPTLVIVDAQGQELAHLAGLPSTLAKDLAAHLDFAHGRIDKAELDKQLASHQIVATTPHQMATRHLQVAQRLVDRGQLDQAVEQIKQGLAAVADDARLHLLEARIFLLRGDARSAMPILEAIAPEALPAWQLQTLRGRALLALGKTDQAREALEAALNLNPQPAEARYFLGRTLEQSGDWQAAAKAYRTAFEHTAEAPAMLGDAQ